MARLFPEAKDYKTVIVRISDLDLKLIETKIKFPLLPGQRDNFQYFKMINASKITIGYVIAASQKGQYGAVEFVFGIDTDLQIGNLYIQRARERDQFFKNRKFLDIFKGSRVQDWPTIASHYTGRETPGTSAVINGLIKELAVFENLVVLK